MPRILANTPEDQRPKYLVMEEVPMMISDKFRKNFDLLLAELTALGYRHRYGILNAADCGVAQNRKRCFCISKLGATPPDLPKPIPLDKRLRDYLEPEPVAPEYYLSEDRLKGLIWSNQKEEEKGYGYRFEAVTEEREREHIQSPVTPEDAKRTTSWRCSKIMEYQDHKYGQRGYVYDDRGINPTVT